MPKPKPDKVELQERGRRAVEWKRFMRDNLFTEVKFAETLGISRRTVQQVKAGQVTPRYGTLRKWNALKAKYNQGKVA
jgi:hypothetical protein